MTIHSLTTENAVDSYGTVKIYCLSDLYCSSIRFNCYDILSCKVLSRQSLIVGMILSISI